MPVATRIDLAPLSSLLATLVILAALPAQRGPHTDQTLGFKVKPPAKWTYLGSEGDMGSLRAIFSCPRAYAPKAVPGAPHTPTLRVLFFPKGKEVSESATTKDGLPRRIPYKDFADYLARVHGPNTKVESGEVQKMGRLKGQHYLVKVSRGSGDLILDTCMVQLEDGELALEFEVLAEQHAKLRREFAKSMGSFSTVPRSETGESDSRLEDPLWETDRKAWKKLSPRERLERRQDYGSKWLAQQAARREAGWKPQMGKSILVLSRADSRSTKRILDAYEVVYAWVEKHFDGISDEAVMPAVLRVFNDNREHNAFRLREPGYLEYHPGRRVIYFWKDASIGNTGDGYGQLFRGVFLQFVHDKDPLILRNMPRWLDFGLSEFMRSSRVKGKKITFLCSDVETGRFRYHENKNTMPALWQLIQETIVDTPEDGAEEASWGYTPECCRLMRWFTQGGSTAMEKEDFLPAYLAGVGAAAAEFGPDPTIEVDLLAITPMQLNELRKKQYERRDKLLETINYKVIPLSTAAWEAADTGFTEFNKNFKQ